MEVDGGKTESEKFLLEKLEEDGFDPNCSSEQKVIYIWQLYMQSEADLANALEQVDAIQKQHVKEMKEVEVYVESVRSLSDEREALTVEFEKENEALKADNENLKLELEQGQKEVSDMLNQQGLDDIVNSPNAEQVAYLLVERARLLDTLEQEIRRNGGDPDLLDGEFNLDQTKLYSDKNQNMKDDSYKITELTNVNEKLSADLLRAQEQMTSLEKKVERFKGLLGKNSSASDDVNTIQEELKKRNDELNAKKEELKSVKAQLIECEEAVELFHTSYDDLEKQFIEVKGELDASELSCEQEKQSKEELLSKISALEHSLISQKESQMKKSSEEIKRLNVSLSQKTTELTTLHENHSKSMANLQYQLDTLTADYQELCATHERHLGESLQIEQEKITLDSVQTELSNITVQYEACAMERDALESSVDSLHKQLSVKLNTEGKLEAHLSKLQAQLDEAVEEKEVVLERETNLLQQIAETDQTIHDLKSSHEIELKNLTKKQRDKLDHASRKTDDSIAELKSQLENAHDEIEMMSQHKNTLTEKCMKVELELQRVHLEKKQAQSHKDDFNEKLEVSQDQIEELEEDNVKLAGSLRTLTADLESTNKEKEKLQEDYATMEKKYTTLEQSINTLQEDHSYIQKEISDLRKDHAVTNVKYTALQQDHQTLQQDYTSAQLKISAVENGSTNMQQKTTTTKQKLANLQEKYKNLETTVKELRSELRAQIDRGSTAEAETERLVLTNERLLISNKELTNQVETLREDLIQVDDEQRDVTGALTYRKMEWNSRSDQDGHNAELTERIILIEKAASQLESDNTELAMKLKQSIEQAEQVETTLKQEKLQLKATNQRLQEQVDRLKKYSETVEKEMESLQEKLKTQSQKMQDMNELKESENRNLKTELALIQSEHRREVQTLDERMNQLYSEKKMISDLLNAKSQDLSALQTKEFDAQEKLDIERVSQREVENRCTKLQAQIDEAMSSLKEITDRKAEVETENERLAAELREFSTVKEADSLKSTPETDNSKALDLAESKIRSLEAQRDELRESLKRVNRELDNTNHTSTVDITSLQDELLTKKEEVHRLKSQFTDLQNQRTFEDTRVDELKQSLTTTRSRENTMNEENHQLKHQILDLEAKLQTKENASKQHQEDMLASDEKRRGLLQKLSYLEQEKETLDLELLASREKLHAYQYKYKDKKHKLKNKLHTSKLRNETDACQLRDRIDYLTRDISRLKSALDQEINLRKQVEMRCSSLAEEKKSLLLRTVDLEDDIRERNRALSLLHTRVEYMEKESVKMGQLVKKLQHIPTSTTTSQSLFSATAFKDSILSSTMKNSLLDTSSH